MCIYRHKRALLSSIRKDGIPDTNMTKYGRFSQNNELSVKSMADLAKIMNCRLKFITSANYMMVRSYDKNDIRCDNKSG